MRRGVVLLLAVVAAFGIAQPDRALSGWEGLAAKVAVFR